VPLSSSLGASSEDGAVVSSTSLQNEVFGSTAATPIWPSRECPPHPPGNLKLFLVVSAGEKNLVARIEQSVDALQFRPAPADIDRNDSLIQRTTADVGSGEQHRYRQIHSRVAALPSRCAEDHSEIALGPATGPRGSVAGAHRTIRHSVQRLPEDSGPVAQRPSHHCSLAWHLTDRALCRFFFSSNKNLRNLATALQPGDELLDQGPSIVG